MKLAPYSRITRRHFRGIRDLKKAGVFDVPNARIHPGDWALRFEGGNHARDSVYEEVETRRRLLRNLRCSGLKF